MLLHANVGRRFGFGGLDLAEMAGRYLETHIQEVGFDAADRAFRKQGFALATDGTIGDNSAICSRAIGQP